MSRLFINGTWVGSCTGETDEVINPADGSVITAVDRAGEADIVAAVIAARRAFDEGPWPATPAPERGRVLARVADLIERDGDSLARTETLDTGKTLRESRLDIADVTAVFRYYSELASQPADREIAVGVPGVRSRIVHEPVGVCALITPWNYPLLQISWKLAPALAAGNTAVVKPSEVTPLSTVALLELLAEADLPRGVVNLLLGPGAPVGSPLTAHPEVDLISFTGGLATGRRIMATAADGMKRIALELGGKNPNIIFADTDLDVAVDYALTGAFLHSGQVCSAGSRIIVEEACYEPFVAELSRRAELIRLGDGFAEQSECGPLVSDAQRQKIEGYVALAQQEGARLRAGGRRPDEAELKQGFFYRPTLFSDCDRSMRIVQEEVFGPVATVESFTTEDQAVRLGNDTRYGLAGAVFSGDRERASRVAARLRHGTIWINDYHPYLPQAEWGGYKQSGIGRELGPGGLLEYYETKHIYENSQPAAHRWFAGAEGGDFA